MKSVVSGRWLDMFVHKRGGSALLACFWLASGLLLVCFWPALSGLLLAMFVHKRKVFCKFGLLVACCWFALSGLLLAYMRAQSRRFMQL